MDFYEINQFSSPSGPCFKNDNEYMTDYAITNSALVLPCIGFEIMFRFADSQFSVGRLKNICFM